MSEHVDPHSADPRPASQPAESVSLWRDRQLAIVHVRNRLERLTALSVGRLVTSPAARKLRELTWSLRRPHVRPGVRTAVLAHVYYPDLLGEVAACRHYLPEGTPLHLTVPSDKIAVVQAFTRDMPAVILHEVENRGRDIAPFLAVLQSGDLDGYDAVLKIHTKRSPHLPDGDLRRRLVFLALAGSPRTVARVLELFGRSQTGIVGWRRSYRRERHFWHENEERVRGLITRMGGEGAEHTLGFFEGSMFWFRPAALARLRGLALVTGDFEPEQGQLDGALHHAIERVICNTARLDDYLVHATSGDALE